MRNLISTATAFLLLSGAAFAGQTEGEIKSIDREKLTITLKDGKTYKLPGELDLDAIKEGMDVVLAYDTVAGVNQITDMELEQ